MATSTYGTPYVQGSDLVSAYPTVSSSLATRVDEVSYRGNGLNAQTGTTYTLVVGDAGKTITLSNASPVAVTLPQDSTADLPDGAVVSFYNLGAGAVTISQGTGATLRGGSITLAQYEVVSLIKLSANTYGRFDGAPAPGLSLTPPTSIANSGGTATLSGNTVTFSGVSSVSLNGCFTGDYDNYRVVLSATGTVAALAGMRMRMRLSGTDATTGNYLVHQMYTDNSGGPSRVYAATDTFATLGPVGDSLSSYTYDVTSPQVAAWTRMHCLGFGVGSTNNQAGVYTTVHYLATSYDGMTIYPSTGTITGSVSVYGYKK